MDFILGPANSQQSGIAGCCHQLSTFNQQPRVKKKVSLARQKLKKYVAVRTAAIDSLNRHTRPLTHTQSRSSRTRHYHKFIRVVGQHL